MKNNDLITGVYVTTVGEQLGNLRDGAVLVENGIIKAVGRTRELMGENAKAFRRQLA